MESSESKKHRLTAPFKRPKRRRTRETRRGARNRVARSFGERGGVCECPGLDESGGKGGFFSRLEVAWRRGEGRATKTADGERRGEASDRKGAEKRERERERE